MFGNLAARCLVSQRPGTPLKLGPVQCTATPSTDDDMVNKAYVDDVSLWVSTPATLVFEYNGVAGAVATVPAVVCTHGPVRVLQVAPFTFTGDATHWLTCANAAFTADSASTGVAFVSYPNGLATDTSVADLQVGDGTAVFKMTGAPFPAETITVQGFTAVWTTNTIEMP